MSAWQLDLARGAAVLVSESVDELSSLRHSDHVGALMPPKVRELVAALLDAGFKDRGGKGSHRNFVHPRLARPITISGASGDDARKYQIRAVERGVKESKQ